LLKCLERQVQAFCPTCYFSLGRFNLAFILCTILDVWVDG